MIKLKTIRYFGKFYEIDNRLGWMPWYKAIIVNFNRPDNFHWVQQKDVRFFKKTT